MLCKVKILTTGAISVADDSFFVVLFILSSILYSLSCPRTSMTLGLGGASGESRK